MVHFPQLCGCALAALLFAAVCRGQSNDTIVLVLDSVLSWEDGTWVNARRDAYSYDGVYLEAIVRQRWESDLWAPYSRTRYAWENRKVVAEMSDVPSHPGWKPADSTVYLHDANGKCTLSVKTSWRDVGTVQVEVTTLSMAYDNNGNMLDSTMVTYLDGARTDTTRTTFEYTDGNLTTASYYGYLPDSSFAVRQMLTYTYDAQNRLITTTMHVPLTTGLIAFIRMTNTYDGPNLTETVTEAWDFVTSAFKPVSRQLFTSDANGNDSLTVDQAMRDGSWRNRYRTTLKWLPEGVVEIDLFERWDTTASAWEPDRVNLYTYETLQTVGVATAGSTQPHPCFELMAGSDGSFTVRGGGNGIRLTVLRPNGRVVACATDRVTPSRAPANGAYLLRAAGAGGDGAHAESMLLVR